MSESLVSMLKKRKIVKQKKLALNKKKGEVQVNTTVVDKTDQGLDMSDFRQKLKLKKNKSFKTIVRESRLSERKDQDVMTAYTKSKVRDLPKKLTTVEEVSEDPSIDMSRKDTSDDVNKEVQEMTESVAKISKPTGTKITKLKSKMKLPTPEEDGLEEQPVKTKQPTRKTKKSKKTRTKKVIETVNLEIPATMIQVDERPIRR